MIRSNAALEFTEEEQYIDRGYTPSVVTGRPLFHRHVCVGQRLTLPVTTTKICHKSASDEGLSK